METLHLNVFSQKITLLKADIIFNQTTLRSASERLLILLINKGLLEENNIIRPYQLYYKDTLLEEKFSDFLDRSKYSHYLSEVNS